MFDSKMIFMHFIFQLPQTQATNSDLFTDDGSMSRDILQKYLTPGAVDDFLGMGMDVNENSNSAVGGEDVGMFNIPNELLVNMPIAAVPAGTKIIHLGAATNTQTIVQPSQSQEPTSAVPTTSNAQQEDTGVATGDFQHEAMEIGMAATAGTSADAATPITHATIPATVPEETVFDPPEVVKRNRAPAQVKKGVKTKNRGNQAQKEPEGEERDATLTDRMALLSEITRIMKDSYGSRRSEVEVWGQFIGLKAGRIREGRRRDRAFMHVEDVLNDAIYEDTLDQF